MILDYFESSVVINSVLGSIPELGQRGATQDRMLYASWVQIPLLPLVPLAQLVRARVLWARGRGFKPHMEHLFARLAQLVERKTFNLVVVGSSPTVGKSLVNLTTRKKKYLSL